jgi:hypothetical protein
MHNWTFQQTISPAETFAVEYRIKVGESYETRSDQVSFASTSEVVTEYTKFEYYDKDGKKQSQDVVANTISTTTTCVGAANPTRWKSKLEASSPAFPGTVLTKRTETFNKYLLTQDGPVEREVTTYEYEPTIAFAGGLAIENYKNIDLGVGNVLVRKTIVEKEENKAADLSKQTTIVYQAWGATSAGKTIAATIMAALKKAATDAVRISGTYTLVDRMSALVCSGVEKTINIGRGTAPAQPTALDQQNDKLKGVQDALNTNGGWLQTNPVGNPYNSQLTDLSFGSDGTNSTDRYDMQFAPDSYLKPSTDAGDNGTGLNYVYVSSQAAAYEYGRAIYAILSGMANGKSVTTELRNLPSEPMGTLYLEAAGTVGRFRANGITFAFDSQGLIAGCDAMLDGGAGNLTGASGTDWFPLMVAASGLPTVTPAANSTPGLANTINAPSGFDPMAPGNIWASFGTAGVEGDVYAVELTRGHVVPAMQENVRRESVSRSLSWVLEVPYSLSATSENLSSVAVSSGSLTVVYELLAGSGSGVIADLSAASGGGGGGSSGGTGAALTFTGGTTMAWASNTFIYGWLFTVTEEKTVKGVGFYDDGQNGLSIEYGFRLVVIDPNTYPESIDLYYFTSFDAAETVSYISVPSGTAAGLSGSWRRVDLASGVTGATLSPGTLYAIVAFNANLSGGTRRAGSDAVVKNASSLTLSSGVVYEHNITMATTGPSYLYGTEPNDNIAYFGPMIFFE